VSRMRRHFWPSLMTVLALVAGQTVVACALNAWSENRGGEGKNEVRSGSLASCLLVWRRMAPSDSSGYPAAGLTKP
jgi:hypothetical protein